MTHTATATHPSAAPDAEPRNPGMRARPRPGRMRATANRSAIERRAATLPGRRSVKKEYQAAWLCRAIT